MVDGPEVLIERQGAHGELVLNLPDSGNLITPGVLHGLHDGLATLVADSAVGAILLRGAGGTFSEGLDLDALAGGEGGQVNGRLRTRFCAQLLSCPKPVVTLIEGKAVAGGAALALCADLIVVEAGAQLRVPEVAINMVAWMNIALLALKYGEATALDVTLSARPFSGTELYDRGMVAAVASDGEGLETARGLTDRIGRFHGPSLAASKALLRAVHGFDDVFAYLERAKDARDRCVRDAPALTGL